MSTPAYLCIAFALIACRDVPTAKTPKGPTVEVSVDDGPVRSLSLQAPVPLASVVAMPPGWLVVRADTNDERTIELQPNANTEIRLFLDQGRPAIGAFRTVSRDLPPEVAAVALQPTASLAGIASVHVLSRRPVLPSIVIVVAGVAHTLTGESLHALPSISEKHVQGWELVDVIKLASDQPVTTARIVGAETFDIASLDPARLYVLKLNQKGEYVFRVWERGARTPSSQTRRVAKIVIP